MSSSYISSTLRHQIRNRAGFRCEYCLLAEANAYFPHEPDHVVAIKHGGETTAENLALACFDCNRFKGTDLSSIDPASGQLTPLFNPRTHDWKDHFSLDGGKIIPLSDVGRTTERLLKLNLAVRIEARETLAKSRRYP